MKVFLAGHTGMGGGALRLADVAPDPRQHRRAACHLLDDGGAHAGGLLLVDGIELPGVAVGDEDIDARPHRPVDDRPELLGRDLSGGVIGRDEDAGNAAQGFGQGFAHAISPKLISERVQSRACPDRLRPMPGRSGTSIRPSAISSRSSNSGSNHSKCSTQPSRP